MKVVKRRRATQDIDEHAAYRFLEKVEETFDLLAHHPRIGSHRFRHIVAGLRAFPVREFQSYIVLYFVAGSRLHVVRIVHASRDLEALLKGPWTARRQS